MELKDNFTNRYFNASQPSMKYSDTLRNQIDLINQPSTLDTLAEGFSTKGLGAPKTAGEHSYKATMDGVETGFKIAANNERGGKLAPLLEQAGQINAQASYLEAQMQESEIGQRQKADFLTDQSYAFSELSKAIGANDTRAADEITRGVLQKFKAMTGDSSIGDFDHFHNGTIYYTNNETGKPDGLNIPQFLAQSGIPPEQLFGSDAPMIMSALSPGYKAQYEDSRMEQQLNRDMGQAKLDDTRAHTGLLNSQSGKMQHEMNAEKPKYNDKVLNNIMKQNTEWVNEMRTENRSMNQAAQAYENIAEHISNEVSDVNGRAGSGAIATLQRALNKAGTESEKNQVLIQYEQLPLLQDLKRIFGARITNADLEQFMKSVPTLDKNPQASIQVANERASEIRRNLKQDELTLEVLENDFGYGEPYNSLAVRKRVDALMSNEKPQTQQTNSVLMQAPDGSQREVPAEQVQAWQQKGAVLLNE